MKNNSRYLDNSSISYKSHSRKSSSISNQVDYSSSGKNSKQNSIYSKKEYKLKENKSKDKYSEDCNYQIESSSKNITDPQKTVLKTNNNYIEQLEIKIQEQAKRLNELTRYKFLCEKRLKQLNPIEELPVTEESLSRDSPRKFSPQSNQKDKYDQLYEKYIILLKKYNELISNNNNILSNEVSHESNGNNDKYKKLKEKYKKLKEENQRTIELLKEETLATEEQRNMIALLKQTIDNDLIKSGIIRKYITSDDVIDFAKIKNEAEEYRKELVLSQALVNSLKSEIEIFMKEKNKINLDEFKNENKINRSVQTPKARINGIQIDKVDDKNYNNIKENDINLQEERKQYLSENSNLKNTVSSQNNIINNILEENTKLKLLAQQTNELKKKNQKEEINNLKIELENTKKELSQYEQKFTYFNDYISNLKQSLDSIKNLILKYIDIYNEIIKEDSNKIFSENFVENLKILLSKVNDLSTIEQYNLDSNHDSEIHQFIEDLLKIIHDEFITFFDTIFENNNNYNEINTKITDLDNKLKFNSYEIQQKQNEIISLNEQLNEQIEENIKLKKSLGNRKLDYKSYNYHILKNQIHNFKKLKDNITKLCHLMIKINKIKDLNIGKLLSEGLNICEELFKFEDEKDLIFQKIKNIQQQENYDDNNQDYQIQLNKEYNTLLELLSELNRKIEEKENRFEEIKDELNNIYSRYNNTLRLFQKRSNSYLGNLGNTISINNYNTERYTNLQNNNVNNSPKNTVNYFTNENNKNINYQEMNNDIELKDNKVKIPKTFNLNSNQIKRNNILQRSQSQRTYEYFQNI